ncbi:hypothetical protein E2C01_003365 [Portunus trituberculatus]|uniref:Uncharacterized protein n=1 Tax=Portunus trituberculatus TaxID=210409 RepID=A0A5B7CNI5_PORTR|nr:hypothetical protein [Portunus trituberculatus]
MKAATVCTAEAPGGVQESSYHGKTLARFSSHGSVVPILPLSPPTAPTSPRGTLCMTFTMWSTRAPPSTLVSC